MNARDVLTALLRQGFSGTLAAAALETGLAKITVYVHMRKLEAEGIAQVVDTQTTRGGHVEIWAAGRGVNGNGNLNAASPAGIVAKALASRHPLQHWAAGSLTA